MCLSIAIERPGDVLNRGEHAGFEWMVIHNGRGYRCGYIKVNPGHPWHGVGYDDVRAADGDNPAVHGGLTFAEADESCDAGGPDSGWWLGFDCVHWHDEPDPSLPRRGYVGHIDIFRQVSNIFEAEGAFPNRNHLGDPSGHVWTQTEVEAECRKLCEQAAAVMVAIPA
jgi:hypothetical protein